MAADPGRAANRSRLREVLSGALSAHSPLDKQMVELRLREGFSTREVASEVGWSAAATKTRLHRARQQLMEDLDDKAQAFA